MSFPFISELCYPDEKTIMRVINMYFIKCLGSTTVNCLNMLSDISSGVGTISKTNYGNVLAHIFCMIDIAIRTQCRLYLLIDHKSYLGSIILGARYAIQYIREIYTPAPLEEVLEKIRSFGHSGALAKIMSIIGITVVPESMRSLHKMCMLGSITGSDWIEIRKLLPMLSFPQRFLSITNTSIVEVLSWILSPNEEINDNIYMHHSAVGSSDRDLIAMSAFGFSAPLFDIPGCGVIPFTIKKLPEKFQLWYRVCTLPQSVASIKEMRIQKTIRNNPKVTLSSSYTHKEISKGENTNTIWHILKSICSVTNNVHEEEEFHGSAISELTGF